jgi:hypothetical protein
MSEKKKKKEEEHVMFFSFFLCKRDHREQRQSNKGKDITFALMIP